MLSKEIENKTLSTREKLKELSKMPIIPTHYQNKIVSEILDKCFDCATNSNDTSCYLRYNHSLYMNIEINEIDNIIEILKNIHNLDVKIMMPTIIPTLIISWD